MWTQEQLDQSKYVAFHEDESKQPLNVGTIDVGGLGQWGPYIMTPVPPFGSLTGENTVEGLKYGVKVPLKNFAIQYSPRSFPVANRDVSELHRYGDGTI